MTASDAKERQKNGKERHSGQAKYDKKYACPRVCIYISEFSKNKDSRLFLLMTQYMNKRFLGVKELSEYLGISINTIYSYIWQKKIPYIKIGRIVKFDLEKIERWLESKSVSPLDKIKLR